MVEKLTPGQVRQIELIQGFIRNVEHVKKLVGELEGSRAARPVIINNICGAIARELSQMRQRALSANVGTLADTAGGLAVLASRQGSGINFKLRALAEGVNSLMIQLDQSLKSASQIEKPDAEQTPS
ncbi:MAG TPA: hypothetical protein VK467_10225 [Gemmatimonadales bacterium]|nr:hypothetical protein [Gemmatimonadales bacterium]